VKGVFTEGSASGSSAPRVTPRGALLGLALAAGGLLVACSSKASSGGVDVGGCGPAPAELSCNLGSGAPLYPYDPATNCVGDAVVTSGLCVSSETACASASLGRRCLFAPDGTLYFAVLRGDEDITGPSWVETPMSMEGVSPPPAALAASADQVARCRAPRCPSFCGTGEPPVGLLVGCDGG
jgi:hypothetical protein